jgi:hypothetical protein
MAFSSQRALTGDGPVRQHHMDVGGRCITALQGHSSCVLSVSFNCDMRSLKMGSLYNYVRSRERAMPHDPRVTGYIFVGWHLAIDERSLAKG